VGQTYQPTVNGSETMISPGKRGEFGDLPSRAYGGIVIIL
jgi:hypothetical protein